jgi:hypothetical protein
MVLLAQLRRTTMADGVDASATRSDAPSVAASLTAATSAAAAAIGIVGQLVVYRSVGFAMLAGIGLAVLAAIVLAHQR